MKGVKIMKIHYSITGTKRKELVTVLGLELNLTPKYLGAPTFAYEIGEYRVEKDGTLTGPDNPGLVADLCGLHDFEATSVEYESHFDTSEIEMAEAPIPLEAELGGRVSPYRDYEEPPAYLTPTELSVEIQLDNFPEEAFINLQRLVASKETLIKKALGVESLPIERNETSLRFPWFTLEQGNEAVSANAATHFVNGVCQLAKNLKRVNDTEKTVENEKYAFRCFLLRLGFIGPEFKKERKLLLSKLSGNSAFKNNEQEVEEDE